jgi:ubiquinone/menaquinone biosynthesis C-methylase UbiE
MENLVGTTNESNRYKWLKRVLASIPAGKRILDAGAGEMQYRALCSHLDYVSQDFAQYAPSKDNSGKSIPQWQYPKLDIISNINDIPQPNASFDAVMCTEVFEHIPDPTIVLRELVRLLKEGGLLILTAPFCSMAHMNPYFYYTGYSKNWYEYWLPKLGMEIIELDINGNYFEWLAQELRRLPWMALYFGKHELLRDDQESLEIMLNVLNECSKKDVGSDSWLSFGTHVLAKKCYNVNTDLIWQKASFYDALDIAMQ